MTSFQFQCPQGHLLEGDESQAGQTCTCPTCGMLFIIPSPMPGGAGQFHDAAPTYGGHEGYAGHSGYGAEEPEEKEVLLHIPCPNGHELETPRDMLGQDVLCPHCSVQFTLREEDSTEYKAARKVDQERRDVRSGNLWLNWAIGIAVVVVVGLIVLIVMSSSGR